MLIKKIFAVKFEKKGESLRRMVFVVFKTISTSTPATSVSSSGHCRRSVLSAFNNIIYDALERPASFFDEVSVSEEGLNFSIFKLEFNFAQISQIF